MSQPQDSQVPGGPAALLFSSDLIFTTKVTSTARSLGHQVLVAGNAELACQMITQWKPRLVLVDLAAGALAEPAALVAYRKLAGPETTLLAFGSHVDTAKLAAAEAAGCDPVLARSQFSARLPELLERYLA